MKIELPLSKAGLEDLRGRIEFVYLGVLSVIPSQVYIDYLNAKTTEDFLKVARQLFQVFPRGWNYNDKDVSEVILATQYRKIAAFETSKIGRDFMKAQSKLREAVEQGEIYNPLWQDNNLEGFSVRLSALPPPNPPIVIATADIFGILRVRLIVDLLGGERIAQCIADDCDIFFKAYKSGKQQKYCSHACRKRAFQQRQKKTFDLKKT